MMGCEGVFRLLNSISAEGLQTLAQGVARLITCLIVACGSPVFAEGDNIFFGSPASSNSSESGAWLNGEPRFLPVDEAFVLIATLQPNRDIVVRWEMPAGYYLYRHQFDASLNALDSGAALATMRIPDGEAKFDEFFGDVEVYYGSVAVQLPVVGTLPNGAELSISYQGCADAGLCYPPQVKNLSCLKESCCRRARCFRKAPPLLRPLVAVRRAGTGGPKC